MKYLAVGLICLVVGVWFGKTLFFASKIPQDSALNTASDNSQLLQRENTQSLANTVYENQREIASLKNSIALILSRVEADSADTLVVSQIVQTGDANREDSNLERAGKENQQLFETELNRFRDLPIDPDNSYELEDLIQDIIVSSENGAAASFEGVECKSGSCTLSLNQLKFRSDFEENLFSILALPQFKHKNVFIDPLPDSDTPTNYRILISEPSPMN